MLAEPECHKRRCKYFKGAKQPNGVEAGEFVYCLAFLEGIPDDIAYGHNLHKQPIQGQSNDIVYRQE
jgi:hypothetical protein